jgi:hypothetical protein
MVYKTINFLVPEEGYLPNMSEFTPEENKLILNIGAECVLESRKKWLLFSQEKIYDKIKKEEIDKLEHELLIEKESCKKMLEEIKKYYEEFYSQKWQEEIKKYEMQVELLKQDSQFSCEKIKRDSEIVQFGLEKEIYVSKETCKQIEEMYKNQITQLQKNNEILLERSCDKIRKETETLQWGLEKEILVYKETSKRMEEMYENQMTQLRKSNEILLEKVKQYEVDNRSSIEDEVNKVKMVYDENLQEKEKQVNRLTENYENQITQLLKSNEVLLEKVKQQDADNRGSIEEEVNKVKMVYDVKLQEKEKQVNRLTENYEKIHESLLVQKNKNVVKGIEGEKKFRDYAFTFQDFRGFELNDKHTQSGEGDFHLHFEEMDILVDAKNYKNGVPSKEREKIKNDLLKNEHLHFAWLVSLNTSIDKYDRCPIMTEWINSEKCIIYINHLLHYEEPHKILRIAYFYCIDLMKFMESGKEEIKWREVEDRQFKIIERIKNARKQIRELNTTIGQFKKQVDMIDNELRDLLNYESELVLESHFALLDDWWEKNIEIGKEADKLISTNIWQKFKQENTEAVKKFDLTIEKFKEFIKSKIPISHLLMRSGIKGAIDIKGVTMKK